jgi:hypothetical protein
MVFLDITRVVLLPEFRHFIPYLYPLNRAFHFVHRDFS